MHSDHLFRKPNEPIFLEDISITHVNGHALDDPCSARVTLHLSPKISCRIASDNLPTWLEKLKDKAFSITTSDGCAIKVFLRYNLNNFFYSKESFKGFLVPYKSPCTVINPDTQIQSIRFSVLNFREFYGDKDKWIEPDGKSRRLGVAILKHENLRIEITENRTFSENRKLLNRDDGYAVTHTGFIQHCDGGTFSVTEAEHLLRGLRALFSFSRGSACGLTLVKAINQNDREMVLEWGTNHTETWSQGGTAWLPGSDGGDSLSQLFPGFWSLYNSPDWSDGYLRLWYLRLWEAIEDSKRHLEEPELWNKREVIAGKRTPKELKEYRNDIAHWHTGRINFSLLSDIQHTAMELLRRKYGGATKDSQ